MIRDRERHEGQSVSPRGELMKYKIREVHAVRAYRYIFKFY